MRLSWKFCSMQRFTVDYSTKQSTILDKKFVRVSKCLGTSFFHSRKTISSFKCICRELSGNKLGDNFTVALSKLLHLDKLKLDKNELTRIPTLRAIKNLTDLDLYVLFYQKCIESFTYLTKIGILHKFNQVVNF